MNVHPDMTRQLTADRRAALHRTADQARQAAAARRNRRPSWLAARLAGWFRPDAVPAPAVTAITTAPVIDLTDPARLQVARRPLHGRAGDRELEVSGSH